MSMHTKSGLTLGLLFSLMATPVAVSAADVITTDANQYVTTDRYTQVTTQPRTDQFSPLDTLISAAFGEEIKTVGQAIQNILEGSSYAWAPPSKGKKEDALLNTLELPLVNREFGPVSLRSALSALAGSAWELKADDKLRVIWFEPKKKPGIFSTHKR